MDAELAKVKVAILELYYERGKIEHEQLDAETKIFAPLLSAGFCRTDIQSRCDTTNYLGNLG